MPYPMTTAGADAHRNLFLLVVVPVLVFAIRRDTSAGPPVSMSAVRT
ncbi:hypothetical protein [Streptosporangium sp. CA-115845]